MWSGIERVEPGTVVRLTDGHETRQRLLSSAGARAAAGARARRGGRGGTPGRRHRGAGRLAGAPERRAGHGRPRLPASCWPRRSRPGSTSRASPAAREDDPDVRVGRELCAAAGVPHSLLPADPHGNMWSDHRRAARVVRLTAGGTASLADAAGFPLGPREGPLPLWHSGQGGEIGRAYYGSGAGLDAAGLTAKLYDAFTARRPHRRELLSDAGREIVESQLREWVDAQLESGVAAGRRARPLLRRAPHDDLGGADARLRRVRARHHLAALVAARARRPARADRGGARAGRLPPPHAHAARAQARADTARGRAALGRRPGPDRARPQAGGQGRVAKRCAARAARRSGRPRPARRRPTRSNRSSPTCASRCSPPTSHPAWEVLDRDRCEALLARPAGVARRDEPLPRVAARHAVRRVARPSARAPTSAPRRR